MTLSIYLIVQKPQRIKRKKKNLTNTDLLAAYFHVHSSSISVFVILLCLVIYSSFFFFLAFLVLSEDKYLKLG